MPEETIWECFIGSNTEMNLSSLLPGCTLRFRCLYLLNIMHNRTRCSDSRFNCETLVLQKITPLLSSRHRDTANLLHDTVHPCCPSTQPVCKICCPLRG